MKIKEIDLQSGVFDANGTKYTIMADFITPARLKHFQTMAMEIYHQKEPKDIFKDLGEIFNISTSGNDLIGALHKIASKSYNARASVGQTIREDDLYLKFCALFVNFEGEDLTRWDDALIDKKVNDWKSEPFNASVFFSLAANAIAGYIESYNEVSSQTFKNLKSKIGMSST